MSIDMTIRQKIIRVVSSAVVCGLSFSFIVGEAAEVQAQKLREWKVAPKLIPLAYLPANPVLHISNEIKQNAWRENLVALNSQTPSVPAPNTEILLASTSKDTLKVISGAPTAVVADMPVALPAEVKKSPVAAVTQVEAPLPLTNEIVKEILVSFEQATTQMESLTITPPDLNIPGALILGMQTKEPQSNVAQLGEMYGPPPPPVTVAPPKEEKIVELAPQEKKTPIEIATVTPVEIATATSEAKPNWTIQGKVIAPASFKEAGHFEIGIFSKIDPEGIPIGFPIVQQILPAGKKEFRLSISAKIDKGFLYGEFVSSKTGKRTWIAPPVNPWVKGDIQTAELYLQHEDAISAVAAASVPQELWKIQGQVNTMFTANGTKIPQGDVVVKVRGRKESTRTDKNGSFSIDLPKIKGTIFLEFLKAGYHPTVVAVPAGDQSSVSVDLASREAIERIAILLGKRQQSSKGVFIGKALSKDGSPMRGMGAQLSLKSEGPYYFNEDGMASTDPRATTNDGRFIFLNVEPGSGFLETSYNGEAIAPFEVSVIEGGELVAKSLTPVTGTIRGRLFNPVTSAKLTAVNGARVRIDGASDWSVTDSYGAFSIGPVRWMKGERIAIEVSAEKFNNHRYSISEKEQAESINLYIFPANYVNRLARSMEVDLDPYAGVILGKVSGESVRIDALADHSVVNSAKDFYFDSTGKLKGSHSTTDPKFGTYVIFNVPKGRTLLQGNDSNGVIKYSESVVSGASTINVVMD